MAPIHSGYYMIGRLKECQIRPKSRSVSRRHCLLHWQDGTLRVFDLDSTSGTQIDGEKIPPRTWSVLPPDGELRCGKICFLFRQPATSGHAAVADGGGTRASAGEATDANSPASRRGAQAVIPSDTLHEDFGTEAVDRELDADDSSGEIDKFDGAATGSMLRGKAWQEDDVAAFLEAEDTVEREKRYESIRSAHPANADDSDVLDGEDLAIADSPSTVHHDPSSPGHPNQASNGGPLGSTGSTGPTVSGASDEPPASGPLAASKPAPLPPKKRRKLDRRKNAGVDAERLKFAAAVLGAILVIAFVAYQAYQFQAGSEVQVIEGID